MIDCPIGKCSPALFCDKCSQLSDPSAKYVQRVGDVHFFARCVLYQNTILQQTQYHSLDSFGCFAQRLFDNRLQGFVICVDSRFPTEGVLVELNVQARRRWRGTLFLFARIQIQ